MVRFGTVSLGWAGRSRWSMVRYDQVRFGGQGLLRRGMVWLVKAVEVCRGQVWSGGFRSGEAV